MRTFFAFEGSTLDRELAAREPSLYREVESQWMRLLADMDAGRPQEAVRLQGAHVLELLERGTRAAEAGSSLFVDSMLIILREGFEAILIVSALAAYLARIGQRSRRPYLYAGAALAVVASIALWTATRSAIDVTGSRREAFEGWTILVATGVLFWVSYWLISKAEADRWQAVVKSRVERAVGQGALFGLGLLAFIVVFREGLETVLFYEAVAARARSASDQSLLLTGFLTGCGALAALFVWFQSIGPRLPMRAFFNVTGGLLYFMAFASPAPGFASCKRPVWWGRRRATGSRIRRSCAVARRLSLRRAVGASRRCCSLAIFALVTMSRGQVESASRGASGRSRAAAGRR
jgi:high-affinity iron transporter